MDTNTAAVATAFLNSFGVPMFILAVLMGFIWKAIWPFAIKRIEASDAESRRRHDEYMKWQGKISDNMESTARILYQVEERMSNHEMATDERVETLKKESSAANGALKDFIDVRHQVLLREVQLARSNGK